SPSASNAVTPGHPTKDETDSRKASPSSSAVKHTLENYSILGFNSTSIHDVSPRRSTGGSPTKRTVKEVLRWRQELKDSCSWKNCRRGSTSASAGWGTTKKTTRFGTQSSSAKWWIRCFRNGPPLCPRRRWPNCEPKHSKA